MAISFSERIIQFYLDLQHVSLNTGDVHVMNPYQKGEVKTCITQFHEKFFNDTQPRIALFGINPGRFGAGITGIPFTDPINLEKNCGISNNFAKKPELSSVFIYKLIETFGGVQKFYRHFLLTALSPLGFTKDGKNINYYDSRELYASTKKFIINSIEKQISVGISQDVCFSLGKGKNLQTLEELNKEMKWFNKIIPFGHPRWVMQYRRKQADEIIQEYCMLLKNLAK